MTTSVKAPRLFRTLNENPIHIKVNSTRAGERSFLRANGFTTVLPHAGMGILGDASGKLRFPGTENECFFADSKKPRYELDSHLTSAGRQNIQSAEKLHTGREVRVPRGRLHRQRVGFSARCITMREGAHA